ncbi:hypothetical protein H5410_044861 [Solanum commersonii]|uniref:F-box domain-containing protein n=1 Tax=Solanum commersonii TaxID=4109 RepID=A0A9J5X845_SOLCO|nr:hypothetical protein H5410_044861 [Solanum commersonii]
MAAGWAGLPNDLLVLIAKRVKVMEDYIAFRGVCTSWRMASPKDNFNVISPQFPLLMLPQKDDDYREFYSLSKDYVLVIAYNTDVNHLAFWRPGDINWNKFRIVDRVGGVSDMIYFKGQFYLVTWSGAIGIIDFQGPNSVPESNIIYLNDDKKLFQQHSTQFYLVDVNDALLLVTRFGTRRSNASRALETVKFEVYELDVVKGLNNDLLVEIAKRVKVIEDFIVFGCVCNSWRTASTKDNFDVLSPQLPLLMLPQKDDYREFYSLSKGKISRRLYLPEAKGRECFPSHQMGWFFTQSLDVGEEDCLLNPFSATKIQLPTLIEDLEYPYIINAILSANPSFISDYVLVISYHTYVEQFAF